MAALTEEEIRIRARARARAAQQQQQPQAPTQPGAQRPGAFDRFARGFGSAVADGMQMPFGLPNLGPGLIPGAALETANLLGADIEDTSGQNFLRRQGERLGVTVGPGEDPSQGIAGNIGNFVGGAGVGGVAAAGALGARAANQLGQAAAPAASTVGRILEDIGQATLRGPTRTGASELGLAGTVGATAGGLEELGVEDEWWAPIVEAGTGLAAAGIPALAGATFRGVDRATEVTGPIKHIARLGFSRLTGRDTTMAGERLAAGRVRGVADNPQAVAEHIRQSGEFPGGELMTGAQRSGDPGVRRLAAEVRAREPAIAANWRNQVERVNRDLLRELDDVSGGGDPSATVDFVRQRKEEFIQRLEDTVATAYGRATERIEEMRPQQGNRDRSEAVMREELLNARNVSNNVMKELYEAAGDAATIPPQRVTGAYNLHIQNLAEADRALIPSYVSRALSPASPNSLAREFGDVPLPELEKLRGRILGDAAEAGRGGNLNRARILNDLGDSIKLSIDEALAANDTHQGEILRLAREYAKRHHDLFSDGAVAEMLAKGRNRRFSTADELTVSKVLGSGGREAATKVGQVKAALRQGGNPEALEPAVSTVVQDEFLRAFDENGVGGARRVLGRYRDVLKLFPGLEEQLQTTLRSGELAGNVKQRVDNLKRGLENPNLSHTQVYLGGLSGDEVYRSVDNVLNAQNPTAAARNLVNMARKDESGRALKGLKQTFLTHIKEASVSGPMRELDDRQILSGDKLRKVLEDPRMSQAMKVVFNDKERESLNLIAKSADLMQRDVRADRLQQAPINDAVGFILQITSRVPGLIAGSKLAQRAGLGVGTLTATGAGARLSEGVVRRAIEDPANVALMKMLNNPDTLRDVLMRNPPPAKRASLNRRINGWLIAEIPQVESMEQAQAFVEDYMARLEEEGPSDPLQQLPPSL